MKRYPVLLALALVSIASTASAEEKKLARTFTVAPGGVLTVDAEGADVFINGSDTDTVVVRIEARGSQKDLEDLQLSAEPASDGVRVEARRPKQPGWFSRRGSWRVETRSSCAPRAAASR